MAAVINTVAAALHTVFSASEDPIRKEMRQACFSYFCLGGVFSNGLMSLLSGMNPSPVSLVFHCLALAVYTVGRLLLPSPKPTRIWMASRLILVSISNFFLTSFSLNSLFLSSSCRISIWKNIFLFSFIFRLH